MTEDDFLAAGYIVLLISIMSMILYIEKEVYAIVPWAISSISSTIASIVIIVILWRNDDDS